MLCDMLQSFPRCFYDKIINFTEFSVTKIAQWIIIACCAYCFRIDYKQRLVLVLFLWLKPNSRTQANEFRDVPSFVACVYIIHRNGPVLC